MPTSLPAEYLLPIDATMGQEVDCYNSNICHGDCDECPHYGQFAVAVASKLARREG